MAKKTEDFDYRSKAAELEKLLGTLQDPDIQIDEATKLHAEGLKLITELETYLKQAENEVRKHVSEA
jgi:exodeoxyribonuclease VII small subunit